MLNARPALLLNFTGNTYHWGCYGTSIEIYQTLLERGYYPSCLSVETTHELSPAPESLAQMIDPAFVAASLTAHPHLWAMMRHVDLVVVNGEGTLHGNKAGVRNLLFLIYVAKHHFRKPVHLINHSLFPSDSLAADEPVDAIYRTILETIDRVVPREAYSLAVARRLGLRAVQGFDCLPRFIDRHRIAPRRNPKGPILLSGGVNIPEETALRIVRAAGRLRAPGQAIRFLVGARSAPASADFPLFEQLRGEQPGIELAHARTMAEWLGEIASASWLVSARFHHSLAAAWLHTPFAVFPSNCPKIEAACEMLGLPGPLSPGDSLFEEKLADSFGQARSGRAPRLNSAMRARILAFAGENFSGI